MAGSGKIYKVRIAQVAADFIREQSAKIQRQILDKISFLAKDPYNRGERIKGANDMFKIRSGDYRIAYKVEKGQLLILVVRVGHRRDFYRFFDK
jgi:mRNA interferase RelE/StbE